MSEHSYGLNDTQPIVVTCASRPYESEHCHVSVTTEDAVPTQHLSMRHQSLIQEALKEPSDGWRQIAKHSLGGAVVGSTITQPVAEFESWRGLVLIGSSEVEHNPRLALERMNVRQVEFDPSSEADEGYSRGRTFAIAPNARNPFGVYLHELSHIAMRHTVKGPETAIDTATKEVQAEVVAFCCQVLIGAFTRPAMAESYIYIHDSHKRMPRPLTEQHYAAMNGAIDTILAAGQ